MKMLLTAIAFAFATPAAAQAAQDPHAQHSAAEHAASQQGGHGDHAAAAGHAGHDGKHDAKHDGCCVKGADGKMVCKMKADGKKSGEHKAAHGDHGGH